MKRFEALHSARGRFLKKELWERRVLAPKPEGANIEAPKAPRGMGRVGRGCPPPHQGRSLGRAIKKIFDCGS